MASRITSFERDRLRFDVRDAGPLDVIDMTGQVHPLCDDFLAASQQAGLAATPDYNGRQEEGVAVYQITTRKGIRASAASAFLRPAMRRVNLEVVTGATVSLVTIWFADALLPTVSACVAVMEIAPSFSPDKLRLAVNALAAHDGVALTVADPTAAIATLCPFSLQVPDTV